MSDDTKAYEEEDMILCRTVADQALKISATVDKMLQKATGQQVPFIMLFLPYPVATHVRNVRALDAIPPVKALVEK